MQALRPCVQAPVARAAGVQQPLLPPQQQPIWHPQCSTTAAPRCQQPPACSSAMAAQVQLQQPPPPLPPTLAMAAALSKDKEAAERQEYYVNFGAAVRALQSDFPSLLHNEPLHLAFCSDGLLFEDRLSPQLGLPAATCSGKEAYSRLMWSLRFHRALFFNKARVEVMRIWEKEPGVVAVRWTARASPRLLDGFVATSSAAISLDGVSEFHFGDSGLITKHVADCVAYSGLQMQMPLLARRYAQTQRSLVPGLAGGSLDEC